MPAESHLASSIVGLGASANAAAESTRLDILRAVDETVEALARDQTIFRGLVSISRFLIEEIDKLGPTAQLDPDSEICSGLLGAEKSVAEMAAALCPCRDAALRDPELRGDHEAAVVGEYECLMHLSGELHAALRDLRWAVLEHDADLESPEGPPDEESSGVVRRLRAG